VQDKITPIFQAARAAERALHFEEALRLYDQILRVAPNLAEVWTNKGLVLVQLERHREALPAFEKARSLNPLLVVPHIFTGMEYLRLGRPREAVTVLQQAIKLEPSNSKAKFELARAFMAVNSYDRAVDLLTGLIKEEPTNDDRWFTLGLAYLQWSRNAAEKLAAGNSPYGALVMADANAVAGFTDAAAEKYRSAIARLTPEQRAELPVDQNTFRVAPAAPLTGERTVSWAGLESGEPNLNSAAARVEIRTLQQSSAGRESPAAREYERCAGAVLAVTHLSRTGPRHAASRQPAEPGIRACAPRQCTDGNG
jgi:tetratricopeptide (TPR) repeat protein